MSKVFKNSTAFTPEKIVPGTSDEAGQPIWEDLAKPERKKSYEHTPEPEVVPQPPSAPTGETDDNGLTTESPSSATEDLEDDFSAPSPPAPDEVSPPTTPAPEPEPIDLDALTQEAYDSGYQDCLKNVEDDFLSSTKALITACTEINTVRETILNNSMTEMQDLVFKIAEKILRISVTEQNDTIINTVEEAIRKAVKSDEFVINVNPQDHEIIKEKSEDLTNTLSGLENIVVKPDQNIEQGGCKIESSNCTVDATIEVQLEMIKKEILENS